MLTLMTPPAVVQKMDRQTECPVARAEDPEVAALQDRAEAYVSRLRPDAVEKYEKERMAIRTEMGLPPVPVTKRGWRVLTARRYAVSGDGYITLG